MDAGIEIPTGTSFTDSQKERHILSKFETSESVSIKCSSGQFRKATITKCPDLNEEKYTVLYLDNDNHERQQVSEDQVEPLPTSVRGYTLLVIFSSMDFISDIVYALFSQFNDENLRSVAILLLLAQFIMFTIFDTKKLSQILILTLYCRDVKERFAKYLECGQYYVITSCLSREYYMHWLPLWDVLRFMFKLEDISSSRPQYFTTKESDADLVCKGFGDVTNISKGDEVHITESGLIIGHLKKTTTINFKK